MFPKGELLGSEPKGDEGICVGVDGFEANFPLLEDDMLDLGCVPNELLLLLLLLAGVPKANAGFGVEGVEDEDANVGLGVAFWAPSRKDGVGADCDANRFEAETAKRLLLLLLLLSSEKAG